MNEVKFSNRFSLSESTKILSSWVLTKLYFDAFSSFSIYLVALHCHPCRKSYIYKISYLIIIFSQDTQMKDRNYNDHNQFPCINVSIFWGSLLIIIGRFLFLHIRLFQLSFQRSHQTLFVSMTLK